MGRDPGERIEEVGPHVARGCKCIRERKQRGVRRQVHSTRRKGV